ncbi:FG-GAP repeat domain-containing protein [Engelhardtia mirabilis]|uniref:FG-GAP repeat protein n=1 Tax=Engelhardtia mirabilis TaxID=2528011 RepID=A0A518BIS1_9BACT|nr:FG-GAP repeat protein [Planctomycetes bacterium Pla133]QDV01190.1 FG-GAP repeat protein [Planctomycetes bacterium Pla86]
MVVQRESPTRRFGVAALLSAALAACSNDGAAPGPAAGTRAPADADVDRAAPASTARPTYEGPPRLLARQEVEVPGRAIGAAAADLDGDGRADLVVTLEEPGTLMVFASSTGGLAAAPRRVDVGGFPLPAVVAHDSAGRELFVASRTTEELQRVDASGAVVERWPLGASPRAIATGDLGVDGSADVVVAVKGERLHGFGAGGEAWSADLRGTRPTCVLVARDGATVWVGTQLPPQLHGYSASDLAGGAAQPIASIDLAGIPRALAEADVDGDGDTELVCAGGDEDLWLLGIDAGGGSQAWGEVAPQRQRAPGLVPVALEAADLDGDGSPELLTIQFYDSGYGAVGKWNSQARRFALSLSEYAGQAPVDLAVADFDGDGTRDLAIANSDARRVSMLPGTGLAAREKESFYQARRNPVGTNPLAVGAGDLDGDGHPEALVANGSDGTVSVLLNRYSILGERRDVAVGPSPTEVVVVDLNGDGKNDAVALVRPPEGARLAILVGDGTGALDGSAVAAVDLGGDASDLTLADLNGDGGRELVVADPFGARLVIVDVPRPLPAGWTPTATPIPVGGAPSAVAPFALPDGRDAIAVAFGGGSPKLVLYELAGGKLRELADAPANGDPADLACGDFDGDGRTDVAWLARRAPGDPQGFLRLYLARDGALQPGPEYPTGLAPAEIVAGDLDGDGRCDLAVAAQNSHNANVWLAAEGGSLVRWPDLGAGLGCLGIELCDLNADGRLDLLVANAFSHDLSVIYNLPR